LNPFKKMKLKTKLRNCDYKLAGTVIKQQYYNDNSYTEINRMIDHFMEEPCFERALDLIDYNEMIVFYFTESCTDGLYVRKTPIEPVKSIAQLDSNTNEEAHTFAEPSSLPQSTPLPKETSSHSEHLQKIQESEQWMDEMISRLAKKPKTPTIAAAPPTPSPPPVKVFTEDEAQTFDTIEFKSPDSFRDIEVFEKDEVLSNVDKEPIVVFNEDKPETILEEPDIEPEFESQLKNEPAAELKAIPSKVVEVFYETEEFKEIIEKEITVFYETANSQDGVSIPDPNPSETIHTLQEDESSAAFKFVASAESSNQWETTELAETFNSSPIPVHVRTKRPSFPNVVATLKIDLHTMIKQLDEYRYELAYHPHNEQQMIGWIEALEKAIDEFSSAIDLIEESCE